MDLVITQNSDQLLCGAPYTDYLISDHLSVISSLKVAKSPPLVSSVSIRKLRAIDPVAFKQDIDSDLYQHSWDTLDELVSQFNNTLRALLDRYAPVKRKHIHRI